MEITLYDEEGEEEVFFLPTKKEVCGRCNGEGTHLCEGMRGHAYSQEEFDREFDDEEREEYFKRGGRYDVTCTACKGKNVVDALDYDAIKSNPEYSATFKRYEEQQEEDAAYEAECRMERMMGA